MKSAVFDIETTALEGIGAGVLICGCVRQLSTNRTITFRLDEYTYKFSDEFGFFERQEKDLLINLLGELKKYDLLIGHNINNFDLGFLKTRAYRHDVPFFLNPITYDTMYAFGRVKLRTIASAFTGKPTKSLAMVADLLGVRQEKTSIYPVEHWQGIWGKKAERTEAMNDIVDHCQRDVRMNSQVYEILLPQDNKLILRRWT